jgi:hypothetical protein
MFLIFLSELIGPILCRDTKLPYVWFVVDILSISSHKLKQPLK